MRELKFRFWDLDLGSYVYSPVIGSNGSVYESTYDDAPTTGYTAEQYTGREDKNNKEIYEGDIIKGINFSGNTFIGHVLYDKVACSFKMRISNGWKWGLYMFHDIEVIGNIHENPELMEN